MSLPSKQIADQETEAASSCAEILRGVGDSFLKSFHETERDFLRLGHELDNVNTKAMALAEEAGRLATMTSGDQVGHAAASLESVLGKIVTICEMGAARSDFSGLADIARTGSELAGIMRDFSRLVKHLSILGVATRIESARLGSQGLGFSTLADDVETLALKIAASSNTILSRCGELTQQTLAARESVRTIQSVRDSCSLNIVEVLKKDLDSLDSLIKSSGVAGQETATLAEGLCESVSRAVLALQFHDIIRQQLEHVAEHSEEVRQEVLSQLKGGGPAGEDEDTEISPWLHSALILQESQLGDARNRFASAMDDFGQSLAEIAAQVETITARAGAMGGSDAQQSGVLATVERGVAGVVESLKEYGGLGEKMTGVMSQVKASIEQMVQSAAEIEEVGSEIELIAINASIKAAHTGDEGRALGVLASAIQKLSLDAAAQTVKVMELLTGVGQHSQALEELSRQQADHGELDQVFEDLNSDIAFLKRIDAQTAESAAIIRARGQALGQEIQKSVSFLSFQDALLASMDKAGQRLRTGVDLLAPILPPGRDGFESPRLKAMLERYTMDAERLVHENVLGLDSSGAGASSSEGDLGDNIELF